MTTLARMAAVDAIDESLHDENAAMKRESDVLHRELHGDDDGNLSSSQGGDDDPMRIMAARDIHVYPKEPAVPVSDPTPVVSASNGLSMPKAVGAAILAGLLAGLLAGTGVKAVLDAMWKVPPADKPAIVQPLPAVKQQPDRWMEYDIQKWVPEETNDR